MSPLLAVPPVRSGLHGSCQPAPFRANDSRLATIHVAPAPSLLHTGQSPAATLMPPEYWDVAATSLVAPRQLSRTRGFGSAETPVHSGLGESHLAWRWVIEEGMTILLRGTNGDHTKVPESRTSTGSNTVASSARPHCFSSATQ